MRLTDEVKEKAKAYVQETYCQGSDDNIEVDDDPDFAASDKGVWVQAWLYCPTDQIGELS